jgi:hypothetical protein
LLKMRKVDWIVIAYPAYYVALASWFYATILVGIAVVGRHRDLTQRPSVDLTRSGVGRLSG